MPADAIDDDDAGHTAALYTHSAAMLRCKRCRRLELIP